MQKIFLFFIFFAFHVSGHAQDWLTFAETSTGRWDFRAGTRDFSKNRGGENIIFAEGRIFWKKDSKIEFVKWYAKVDDCNKGNGKLVTTNMSGDFQFDNDFVLNGGSVASSLADALCYPLRRQNERGI
ncbi:MAG: hypothetical protein ACKOFG_17145 [Limnohabitans sp.]